MYLFFVLIVLPALSTGYSSPDDCVPGEVEVTNSDGSKSCELEIEPPSWLKFAGCTLPYNLIRANENMVIAGKDYSCFANGFGGYEVFIENVKYSKCSNTKKNGEEWTENNVRFRCENYGEITAIACITPNGTEIKMGASKKIGDLDIFCKQYKNGTVHMNVTQGSEKQSCLINGKVVSFGEEILVNNFLQGECREYGHINFNGCKYSSELHNVALNSTDQSDLNGTTICYKENNKYYLQYFDLIPLSLF